MGVAASLFFSSNDTEKQTLLRRCTPSDEQFEEQQERWNELAAYLIVDLKSRTGNRIRTWLQGSYKFATQIRPVRKSEEFDIDLGVYALWEGAPTDSDYDAQDLKKVLRKSIASYVTDKCDCDDVDNSSKTRCERINYSKNFHIDVPCYHLDEESDTRTLATESGWEKSDPKAIYTWFKGSFDETIRKQVRRQVRYVKTWAALKFPDLISRPSSILLTVLVANAAISLKGADIPPDDELLARLLALIVQSLEKSAVVSNPVAETENLNRLPAAAFDDFLRQLKEFSANAEEACEASTEFEAADCWQTSFEHMFPMPEPDVLDSDMKKSSIAIIPPEIKITARSRTNQQAAVFTGTNAIGPIPKDCDINFEIINANLMPHAATFQWVVRNEGREAELVNDMGHSDQVGLIAHERSAYKGVHYMDCTVRVGKRTVAVRRVPVVISGMSMPARTPKRHRYPG